MQNFLEIAKTDFTDTFSGAWIFPMLLVGILWILWQEKDWMRKILLGILLMVLFAYPMGAFIDSYIAMMMGEVQKVMMMFS